MPSTPSVQELLTNLKADSTKLGDIKKIAKQIKKNQELATELWADGGFHPRMLAVLILDKSKLDQETLDRLAEDLQANESEHREQIADWLMANQLTKSRKTLALLESWQNHPAPILRRLFWYYQARLRWTGKSTHANTADLVETLESDLKKEAPEVQWAMNFTAGWIGIYEPEFRSRCIRLGEDSGLYRDEPVCRGCTPNYLPEFIRIEAAKRGL